MKDDLIEDLKDYAVEAKKAVCSALYYGAALVVGQVFGVLVMFILFNIILFLCGEPLWWWGEQVE